MTVAAVAKKRPDRNGPKIAQTMTLLKFKPFLKEFEKVGNIEKAAEKAKIARNTIYNHIARDPEAAEALEEARRVFIGKLEEELTKRSAGDGTRTTTTAPDGSVTTRMQQSDRLLEMQLKRHQPAYRDNNGVNINLTDNRVNIVSMAPAERAKTLKAMIERAAAIEGEVTESMLLATDGTTNDGP